ncbi:MAG: 16S rRNA (guanine(527)-N(7))-methyltransferase RsmG [Flavobacteriales bacterium]|jgi:16S rRNA (guanine527-N7)-methyltransferase|nr:16S rRNA (guanine(527)-N(7))-methyltransferase RsmG [Flavobacteriales bacterium]
MKIIQKYFPGLTAKQIEQFEKLMILFPEWNAKINCVSRKDIHEIETKHILHSLAIAKIQSFKKGADVLDVGTGGGFPGIPLAILFPQVNFHLVDSIGKKITVVKDIAQQLGLKNVRAEQRRAESIKEQYDFVVSRAVTSMDNFLPWVKGRFKQKNNHDFRNGILYLKGGDLKAELAFLGNRPKIYDITDLFEEEFFETKKVVYLKM